MRGERFDAERFGRVVAAQKKIDSQFLRGNRRPVRRFACNEGVDFLLRDPINFRTRRAGDDPNPVCFGWSEIECLYRAT